MEQASAEPRNNFPPTLQQQLVIAAQQVRSSQMHPEQGQQCIEQRGSIDPVPPPRGTHPYRGPHRPFRAMQPFHQPPGSHQSFRNRQGHGAGRSLHQNKPNYPDHQQLENLGPRRSITPSPGHITTQQPPNHHTVSSRSITTVSSGSYPATQLSSSSSQNHLAAESFPPLGSSQLTGKGHSRTQNIQSHPTVGAQNSVQPHLSSQMSAGAAQAFFERASTGAYRGHGLRSHTPHHHLSHVRPSSFMTDQNSPARGGLVKPRLYNPASDRRLGDPNSHSQQELYRQGQYLDFLAGREANREVHEKELLEKEAFRKRLENIVQELIAEHAKDRITVHPKSVRLKCYGSLASGFAIPGSDMDLLLMFPKDQGPVGPIEVESRRLIEKGLLDLGYGARLLTKTRVPILRVCQSPSPTLLANLKRERVKWEEETKQEEKERLLTASGLDPNRIPSDVTDEQSDAATVTFAELDVEPSIIPLPPSPDCAHANLEYTADVGIQCDINFSNYVAIHNTTLLRCYCKCDPRVRPMGVFVKLWSKSRNINSPYHGTLSSYGYIMMVLHYLMNIAQPPVIPNLQHLAKDEDMWNNRKDIELFEGFDVRFLRDEALLEKQAQAGLITKNRESLGSLLRGFFRYYSDGRGFHWLNEVISIRTQGGLLTKTSKDWTEAKRAGKDNSVRLRYLLAIEDPFETDHNIARTVGHSGVVAIRSEFRRAWNILNNIRYVEGRWLWHKGDGGEGEDFFAKAEDRGDLLRQDQEYHREKMRKVREMERKREAERKLAENGEGGLAKSVDGRSAAPSRVNCAEGDASISGPRLSKKRSKLMRSDCVVQLNCPVGKGKKQPQKGAQLGKVNKNDETEAHLENIKSASRAQGYDVSNWIETTAASTSASKVDAGGCEETSDKATLHKSCSPGTPEFYQRKCAILNSSFDLHLKSLRSFTSPKPPSSDRYRKCAPAPPPITSELKHSITIDPKNALSAWNLDTAEGRWLMWRDTRVCAGTWKGISPGKPFASLDRQYPYDASRPLPDIEQQRRVANIRDKRNQYFNLKGVESKSTDLGASQEKQAIGQERKDSAISMGKLTLGLACKPKSAGQPSTVKQPPPFGGERNADSSRSAFTLALSSNNPEVVHDPEYKPGVAWQDFLTPVECDIPVPNASNFRFDPAQLRDLGIIARGGSGCARNAMEQQKGDS